MQLAPTSDRQCNLGLSVGLELVLFYFIDTYQQLTQIEKMNCCLVFLLMETWLCLDEGYLGSDLSKRLIESERK